MMQCIFKIKNKLERRVKKACLITSTYKKKFDMESLLVREDTCVL